MVNDLANLTLQVRPYLLLILDNVLSFVQLGFQIVDVRFELSDLVIFILLKVCQHLLVDQDLSLIRLFLLL